MRAFPVALAACALLLTAPTAASADVIFDPADADELAAMLADATATQDVCYGWDVTVYDVTTNDASVGSNFGAGRPVSSGSCAATVEFTATITYTSESSESEDSATYDVRSEPSGIQKADLDGLGINWDDLAGDNPDVAIGKAVVALPLLAADKGIADGIEAAPQTGAAPADAKLTDNPGGDWWRANGGTVLWGLALIAAGLLFAWWVVRMNRKKVAAAAAEADERARRAAAQRPGKQQPRQQAGRRPPPYAPAPPTPPITRPPTSTAPPASAGWPPAETTVPTENPAPAASAPGRTTPPAETSTVDERAGAEPNSAQPAPPDQKDKE